MKSKEVLLVLGLILCSCGIAHAVTQLNSINVNFIGHTATITTFDGDFVSSNKTINNGDIVQTTSFVPEGKSFVQTIRDPLFTEEFGQLSESNAVNMDAVTNITIGQTNIALAGYDTTNQEFTAN